STYATIISTIQDRKYVLLAERKFKPTDLGLTVTDLLVKHFPEVMNVEFTAGIEDKLDEIEDGNVEWEKVMTEFWGPFQKSLEDAKEQMESVKEPPKETGEMCPNCGKPLVIRESRFGEFVGCSGYPECKTIISKPKNLGVKCPKPGCEGEVIEKRSKRGKIFYGCDKYPDCDFVSWDRPLDRKCPKCDSLLAEKKWFGRSQGIKCTNEACDYKESVKTEKKEAV
ncbi:MAG TPA: topoisomerase DNA-binding C4 zinc finger domain-containing protein, partial [Armatimonadota bacterium]